MNEPSRLFKLLAPFQDKKCPDNNPSKYAAEYFDTLFKIDPSTYELMIKTTESIIKNSKNPLNDLDKFIKGAVLSKPYNIDNFTGCIAAIAGRPYASVTQAVNTYLDDRFRTRHPHLYDKLNLLEYENTNTPFKIYNSKNPAEIQEYLGKTNICISTSPLNFFQQLTDDVGTLHILAVQRDQINNIKNMQKGQPNVGHIILNAYQSEKKNETLLSVDSIWINNNNKELVCHLIDSLYDLGSYLNLQVIDKTMSKNYIHQNGHRLDIFEQKQNLYKLGKVPEFQRYNKLMHQADKDDGFFILKPFHDCK